MPIRELRFSRDGTYLFTASDDRTVNCWDAKRNYLFVQSFEGAAPAITWPLPVNGQWPMANGQWR
eukprot:8101032-Prorocentrum_lima.AAC.1